MYLTIEITHKNHGWDTEPGLNLLENQTDYKWQRSWGIFHITIRNIAGKVDRDEYELYWLTSCRSSSFGHCCLQITLSLKGGLLRVYPWCQGFLFLNTSSCRVTWNKVVYMQCLSRRGIPWISHSQLNFLRYTLQPLY